MNPNEIVTSVRNWYGSDTHWGNSNKSPACTDWQLLQQGAVLRDKDVLNIGCFYPGDEVAFSHLTKSWTAIDFCPEVIERCNSLVMKTVKFLCMDAQHLQFENDSFDVVLDFSSGDQMPEEHYDNVLKEIHRVLRPSGLFIVTFASGLFFKQTEVFGDYGYSRIYKPSELATKIVPLGFHCVQELNLDKDRAGMIWQKNANI